MFVVVNFFLSPFFGCYTHVGSMFTLYADTERVLVSFAFVIQCKSLKRNIFTFKFELDLFIIAF